MSSSRVAIDQEMFRENKILEGRGKSGNFILTQGKLTF